MKQKVSQEWKSEHNKGGKFPSIDNEVVQNSYQNSSRLIL
jgi:hypothetical protein